MVTSFESESVHLSSKVKCCEDVSHEGFDEEQQSSVSENMPRLSCNESRVHET